MKFTNTRYAMNTFRTKLNTFIRHGSTCVMSLHTIHLLLGLVQTSAINYFHISSSMKKANDCAVTNTHAHTQNKRTKKILPKSSAINPHKGSCIFF